MFVSYYQFVHIVLSIQHAFTCSHDSPDGEIVAFVTGNGTVLEMTKNWDPMTEASILGDGVDEEASSAVDMKPTVNWAKSTLTWRGDGQYFAVGYSGGISVFDRQGVLQSRYRKRERLTYMSSFRVDCLCLLTGTKGFHRMTRSHTLSRGSMYQRTLLLFSFCVFPIR